MTASNLLVYGWNVESCVSNDSIADWAKATAVPWDGRRRRRRTLFGIPSAYLAFRNFALMLSMLGLAISAGFRRGSNACSCSVCAAPSRVKPPAGPSSSMPSGLGWARWRVNFGVNFRYRNDGTARVPKCFRSGPPRLDGQRRSAVHTHDRDRDSSRRPWCRRRTRIDRRRSSFRSRRPDRGLESCRRITNPHRDGVGIRPELQHLNRMLLVLSAATRHDGQHDAGSDTRTALRSAPNLHRSKSEHRHQVADCRSLVGRQIDVGRHRDRVRHVVAAAARQRAQAPVALDELQHRSVVVVGVVDDSCCARTARPPAAECAGRRRRSRVAGCIRYRSVRRLRRS